MGKDTLAALELAEIAASSDPLPRRGAQALAVPGRHEAPDSPRRAATRAHRRVMRTRGPAWAFPGSCPRQVPPPPEMRGGFGRLIPAVGCAVPEKRPPPVVPVAAGQTPRERPRGSPSLPVPGLTAEARGAGTDRGGCSNRQIVRTLVTSRGTLAAHGEHVLAKLPAPTRTHAAVRAERTELHVPPRAERGRSR
jgi:hypothetical protein